MRVFLAVTIAAVVFAGGGYSIVKSVKNPAAEGTYTASTTGASSRIDWSDRINAGFDE